MTIPNQADPPESEQPATDATGPSEVRASSAAQKRSPTRSSVEWLLVIVGAVVVALVIRGFVVQAFRIPSESMSPTLLEGDRVVVNKLSYDAHDLNRGDVVVFGRPESLPASAGEPEDLIKRVIGLPGDTIVARDGDIFIDDHRLNEPYLPDETMTYNLDSPLTVPEGKVFVMGDNRGNSTDSRFFGPVDADSVIGRAFSIIWPPSRAGAL